jgi:hypothetical protein
MVGGGHVSLHAAKHLDPVVALALGHSVHEEPDAADEGRTLGADGGAQRCVARAVQRTAHTQLCSKSQTLRCERAAACWAPLPAPSHRAHCTVTPVARACVLPPKSAVTL